jgi:CHAD domain
VAKARQIRGIRPKASLRTNARVVIAVRLEELLSFRAALGDPSRVRQLHDMRIAAKRLRYSLEMFAVCFPESGELLKQLTDLQESLGDIHDLDVLLNIFRERLAALDLQAEQLIAEIMASDLPSPEKNEQAETLLTGGELESRRRGLVGLIGDKIALRAVLYDEFSHAWVDNSLDLFASHVREMTELVTGSLRLL